MKKHLLLPFILFFVSFGKIHADPHSLALTLPTPELRDNTLIFPALALFAEAVAGWSTTQVFVVGGAAALSTTALVVTFQNASVVEPVFNIDWDFAGDGPNEDPFSEFRGPKRPLFDGNILKIVQLTIAGEVGYLVVKKIVSGNASSVSKQLQDLYNTNTDFQAQVDALQEKIIYGTPFCIPVATAEGVRYRIFVPLTDWGLVGSYEVYDPVSKSWARINSTDGGWVVGPSGFVGEIGEKLGKSLVRSFAPDGSPQSDEWQRGLAVMVNSFARIQNGTATIKDYSNIQDFMSGDCLGEPDCIGWQKYFAKYFAKHPIVASEENEEVQTEKQVEVFEEAGSETTDDEGVSEDEGEEDKEPFAIDEVLALVDGPNPPNDSTLLAEMQSLKAEVEKVDAAWKQDMMSEYVYGIWLWDLEEKAAELLEQHRQIEQQSSSTETETVKPKRGRPVGSKNKPKTSNLPSASASTSTESGSATTGLTEQDSVVSMAFDRIVEAKDRKLSALEDPYLNGQMTDEEYDSAFNAIVAEAEYLTQGLLDFAENSSTMVQEEVAELIQRFKEFVKVEETDRGDSAHTPSEEVASSDFSTELTEMTDEIQSVITKAKELKESAKAKVRKISRGEYKKRLRDLDTKLNELVKKLQDFVKENYSLPEQANPTSDVGSWADEVLKSLNRNANMTTLKKAVKVSKEACRRMQDMMKEAFRKP